MFKNLIYYLLITSAAVWSTNANAVLTIEITQGADVGIPIAVVPFGVEGQVKPVHDVPAIVAADLARSGRFSLIPKQDFLSTPHRNSEVIFKDWRIAKILLRDQREATALDEFSSIVQRQALAPKA